jgi:hypothetical protein
MLAVALLGIVGGTGLVLYLVARRLLDYTVFGLLGHRESCTARRHRRRCSSARDPRQPTSPSTDLSIALVLLSIETILTLRHGRRH